VAVWVPGVFWDFYSVKNHKITNNFTTNKATEKISHFYVSLAKFENDQILLNKISHRFIATTKLFTA
jgi:hypothetical protein